MAEIEPIMALDPETDARLTALERPGELGLPELARALGETVTAAEAGEADAEIARRHAELVGVVTEVEAGLGPKFEEVVEGLKEITNEDTEPEVRRAAVILLKAKYKNISFDDAVDYGGVSDKDKLELTMLGEAVKVIGAGEVTAADQWGSVRKAADFLENEYNIQVDRVVRVEVETEKQRLEAIIGANERDCVRLLAADFDQNNFDTNYNRFVEKILRASDAPYAVAIRDHLDAVGGHLMVRDEDIFEAVQEVYLNYIIGQDNLNKIGNEALKIAEWDQNIIDHEPGYETDESKNGLRLLRLTNKKQLTENVREIAKRRNWEGGRSAIVSEYLARRLGFVEGSSDDKSDVGIIVKVLSKAYLESDIIGGNKNIEISKENNQELLRQIVKIHDIAVTMDSPTFKPENMSSERLNTVDEAMIAMLTIKKDGVSLVPKVIEVFDDTMREEYGTKKKEIDIDNSEILMKVMEKLRGQDLFGSDEEMRVFVKMGRDICRITGVDAQYGYPVDVEKGKPGGLALSVKGSFLRGLLNFNKALITYGTDERLTGNIKLGLVPFWNNLRGDEILGGKKAKEILESSPITAVDIENLIRDKMLGKENFLGWFGTLKGFVEAKNAESDFMNGKPPKLDDFFEKVVPAYHGYMKYTPDKEREYLRNRFAGCVTYFSNQVGGFDLVREAAKKTFMPGNVFDGKGIFSSLKEMSGFFKKDRLVISTQTVKVKSRNDEARDAGQRGDILGVIKSIFIPK